MISVEFVKISQNVPEKHSMNEKWDENSRQLCNERY